MKGNKIKIKLKQEAQLPQR